jgi:hypothetical protein
MTCLLIRDVIGSVLLSYVGKGVVHDPDPHGAREAREGETVAKHDKSVIVLSRAWQHGCFLVTER